MISEGREKNKQGTNEEKKKKCRYSENNSNDNKCWLSLIVKGALIVKLLQSANEKGKGKADYLLAAGSAGSR